MHTQLRSLFPGLLRGGSGMKARSSAATAVHPFHGPADILEQLQMAVVVTDRGCNLLYANAFAANLLGLPDAPARLVGRSLVSIGFEEGDARRVNEVAALALRGPGRGGPRARRRRDRRRPFLP